MTVHQEKENTELRRQRFIRMLSFGGGLILEMIFSYFFLGTEWPRKWLSASVNYDILFYIIFLLLAFWFCVGCYFVWNFILRIQNYSILESMGENRQREQGLEIAVYALGFVLLSMVFIYEPFMLVADNYYLPWHESRRLQMLVLLIGVWTAWQFRREMQKKFWRTGKINVWPLQILLSLLAGWGVYQPNCFNVMTSFRHTDAYFTSVYRVLQLQPYNEINCGMYGFYGIILAPFVKLLGGSYGACVLVLAILTVLIVLCHFYVLNKLVQNSWLRILGSIGIVSSFVSAWEYVYLQLWPHRLIFSGILLAFIVWKGTTHREGIKWEALGMGLLILSLVWNLETGIGCVAAYIGSEVVSDFQEYPWNSFMVWKKTLLNILKVPISLAGAWLFVGIYNLCVGEVFISLNAFLFPFLDNPYVNHLAIELPWLPSAWMLFCFLLYIAICIILWSTSWCGSYKQNDKLVYLSACVLGVAVQFVYYVNRAVYGNLYIVLPIAVIVMAFLAEYMGSRDIWKKNKLGNGLLRSGAVVQTTILALLAIMTICRYFPVEETRDFSRDMQEVKKLTEMISDAIPKDTLGIGKGIPILYSYLGWDTKFYALDMTDLGAAPVECKRYFYEVIENAEDIFMEDGLLYSLRENPQGIWAEDIKFQELSANATEVVDSFYETHELQWSCEILGSTYSYYRKN